jgi:dihydroneopterin aldolase
VHPKQDSITLSGIRIFPHIGTTSEERSVPQECSAELILWGDFEAAASTDSLEESVDYTRVLAVVQQTAAAQAYNLVETLAYRIVRRILQQFPIHRVRIKLRKRPAVLANDLDFIEIEVEES